MRRRRNNQTPSAIQDPGKDLFAYLFLMVMVFSFMLLMSTEERREHQDNQAAPEIKPNKTSTTLIAQVAQDQLGRLIKNDMGIFLAFAGELYDPLNDVDRLKADNRIIVSSDGGGGESSLLYLIEDTGNQVLLTEYLNTFQKLGSHGIRVAFAEKVR